MRAAVMYGAGDVRVENVPDPVLREPTDAIVRVVAACVCGSDLWPCGSMPSSEPSRRMGHEFLGVVEDVGTAVSPVRTRLCCRHAHRIIGNRPAGRVTGPTGVLAESLGRLP